MSRNAQVLPALASRSVTVAEWLAQAVRFLSEKGVPEARANAEFLMAEVLGVGRNDLALDRSRPLSVKHSNHFWHLTAQKGRRLPLAYVLGSQPFMGLGLKVTKDVLVPRPETEELAAEAARLLKDRAAEPFHILEIGTGSGCIAISLAAAFPRAVVYATDASPAALKLAAENAMTHHASQRIRFVEEDIFKPSLGAGWADLLVSNPPYIPTGEFASLEPEVLHEPRLALDGGPDGLKVLREIIAQAPRYLKPGGFLVLEIGSKQGRAVAELMRAAGFDSPMIRADASGLERIAVARKENGPIHN
ncbi:MAG: peptide chain release factor N(5)-glutamine methyltransferase [Elusimicrobia bacterium]|nr:peptide chain release factor N(5)-glutamine methyltransferase [Elusimicrobiota bacterium]